MDIKVLKIDQLETTLQPVWKISRPGQSPQLTKDILFDAQLLEFPRVTLHIKAPILMRDAICGYRDHVVWAQTSRVNDPIEYTDDYQSTEYFKEQMLIARDHGSSQDTYRLQMPITANTEFSAVLSARRIGKLLRFLNSMAYCHPMFGDFRDALADELSEHGWSPLLLTEKVSDESPWPRVDDNSELVIPYGLFAQLIRHRQIHVESNLSTLLVEIEYMQLDYPIAVALHGSSHFLRDVSAKRNCWIAQGDLWKPIVELINAKVGHRLPCDGGKDCPWAADNISRLRAEDPNPPCPIWLKQAQEQFDSGKLLNYAQQTKTQSSPTFWENHIEDLSSRTVL